MIKILRIHFLLFFSLLLMVSVLTSCGKKMSTSSADDIKKKELELKEKELKLKEEELKRKEQSGSGSSGYDGSSSRLFPEASERSLTARDVENLGLWDLKVMRNEIFADYGYRFKTEEMRDYFSRQRWYSPRYDDVNNMLTKTEKDNIELIKRYEERLGNNDFGR